MYDDDPVRVFTLLFSNRGRHNNRFVLDTVRNTYCITQGKSRNSASIKSILLLNAMHQSPTNRDSRSASALSLYAVSRQNPFSSERNNIIVCTAAVFWRFEEFTVYRENGQNS